VQCGRQPCFTPVPSRPKYSLKQRTTVTDLAHRLARRPCIEGLRSTHASAARPIAGLDQRGVAGIDRFIDRSRSSDRWIFLSARVGSQREGETESDQERRSNPNHDFSKP
jgi:hypothetical protein